MRILLILFFLLGITCSSFGQNDFLLLRKNNRTIRQFYPGITIAFFIENKQFISGQVTAIRNDSIYLVQYDVRTLRTGWGSAVFDTITRYNFSFAINDIKGFPTNQKITNVTFPLIMIVGSAGYAALNIINAGTQKESLTGSANLGKLGLAAAVFATGYLWKHSKKEYIGLGRKYKLIYLRTGSK